MNYNKDSVRRLLGEVNTIDKAYKVVKQNTGEDFNLFQILGMETAEVKTHSKFLAELLNPNGTHLQGDVFLKLFIDYLNKMQFKEGEENSSSLTNNQIELNSENAKVHIERHIGKVNNSEGGRIDIVIEDNHKNLICIENKIYAGEQDKQMQRYGNYAKNFNRSHLFYLTLWGNETKTNGDETVYPISYKTHIIGWLELCKKDSVNLPILRETIGQYINLIKKLTHQTTNKNMEKEMQELILRNLSESKLIYQNFEKSAFNLYNNIINNLEEELREYLKDFEWELYETGTIGSINDRGFLFIKPKFLSHIGGFGIEEFNPLCKYHHFGHRIFYGITNWKQNIKFLEQAKDINKNNSKGSWINYDFPKSDFFDFEKSTESHIPKLLEKEQQEQFAGKIFANFKEYFEKNQKEYLDFLNHNNLFFNERYTENEINKLENIDLLKFYDFVNSKIAKDIFKKVEKIWIWKDNKQRSCLVVNFKGNFRFDFILKDNQCFIQFIDLEKTAFKDKILQENDYTQLNNGRYESKIEGNTIKNVIDNLINRIQRIDDILFCQ